MKYHITHQSGFHTWNEFHRALSQQSLMPSLTWLLHLSQDPQRDLLEPVHLRQHLTDWGFFFLFFFLLQFSGHLVETTSGKTRGDALVSQRNKTAILVVLTNVVDKAAAASLPWGSVMLGSSVHCFVCPLLLGWHGRSWHKTSWRGVHRFWYCRAQPAQGGQVLVCCSTALHQESPHKPTSYSPCHDLVGKGWKLKLSKCFYTPTV